MCVCICLCFSLFSSICLVCKKMYCKNWLICLGIYIKYHLCSNGANSTVWFNHYGLLTIVYRFVFLVISYFFPQKKKMSFYRLSLNYFGQKCLVIIHYRICFVSLWRKITIDIIIIHFVVPFFSHFSLLFFLLSNNKNFYDLHNKK